MLDIRSNINYKVKEQKENTRISKQQHAISRHIGAQLNNVDMLYFFIVIACVVLIKRKHR